MLSQFDESRLKLKRARYHIGDLTEQIRAYLRRTPFYLEIDVGFTPETKKWVVRVTEEVPQDFSAIIGDVIHNLRTALDLMACELVRANGKDDSGVYFPFSKTAADFDGMIKSRNMDRASPEAISLLKSFKPYSGGNDPLRALHDLDVRDKHQALIPVSEMVGAPDIPWAQAIRFGPLRDGMSVAVHESQGHLPIGFRARGEFQIHFPPFYTVGTELRKFPLGGQVVVPTLISLANYVEGIIEAFAAL